MWLSALQTTLTLFAAALFAFALFWDRPGRRGRPALRCRKCWFDLTGAKDVTHASRESPITCPECGREHRSLRSMTRTRRRKRFIAAAGVILVLMYSLRVAPAMRTRGWIAGVPGVCLVAMVPFFSEAEGSSDRYLPDVAFRPVPPPGILHERILDEMSTRLQGKGAGSTLGWPSRRLLLLLARIESAKALTDPLAMKGTAFRACVSTWCADDLLFDFEREWARRQVFVSVTPHVPIYDNGMVYGEVSIRTLTGEEAWVWTDSLARLYVPQRSRWPGFALPYGGPGRSQAQARAELRYERYERVNRDGSPFWDEGNTGLIPIGGRNRQSGEATDHVTFRAYMSWSVETPYENRGRESPAISVRVDIPANQIQPVPALVASVELKNWITARVQPELYLDYDPVGERFRPALRFNRIDQEVDTRFEDGIIFGGRVEIRPGRRESDRGPPRALAVLGAREHFWLLEASHDPESDPNWQPAAVRSGVSIDRPRSWLTPSFGTDANITASEQLVVYISEPGSMLSMFPDLQGLFGADAIYAGGLIIPIPNWTPDEFRRFITSGYLPDHAMD